MAKESETNATVIKGCINLWLEMELQGSIINSWENVPDPAGWMSLQRHEDYLEVYFLAMKTVAAT